jgi:excisionase family DNA binding protein
VFIEEEIYNIKKLLDEINNRIDCCIKSNGKVSNDELLTTAEVSKLLKCNKNSVGVLLSSGLLPYLKLGNRKIRRTSLEEFLIKYEGWDLTDPFNPKSIVADED